MKTSRARRLQEPVGYIDMKEALRKDNVITKNPKPFFFLNLYSPGESWETQRPASCSYEIHRRLVLILKTLLRVAHKPENTNNSVSLEADDIHIRFLQNVKYESSELIPIVCNLSVKIAAIIKGLEGN